MTLLSCLILGTLLNLTPSWVSIPRIEDIRIRHWIVTPGHNIRRWIVSLGQINVELWRFKSCSECYSWQQNARQTNRQTIQNNMPPIFRCGGTQILNQSDIRSWHFQWLKIVRSVRCFYMCWLFPYFWSVKLLCHMTYMYIFFHGMIDIELFLRNSSKLASVFSWL